MFRLTFNRTTEGILTIICGLVIGGAALILNANAGSSANYLMLFLLGGLLGVIVVLVIGNLKYLLIGVIFVDMATQLDFYLNCDYTKFLSTCGFNISFTTLALVGLYVLWLIEIRRPVSLPEAVRHPRLGLIGNIAVGFVGAGILSLLAARDLNVALFQIWIFLTFLACYFYLANNINSQQEVLYIIFLFVIGLAIQNVFLQILAPGAVDSGSVSATTSRLGGSFRNANVAGGYLAQVFSLLLACFALKSPKWQRLILSAILLFAIYNLIATESRGGWTSCVVGTAVILVVSLSKKWIGFKNLILAALVVTILMVAFSGTILTRLTADDNGAADARAPLADIALSMIRDHPIVGVGLNNSGILLYDYIAPDHFGAWLALVHNGWLWIWSETGTIGIIFYLGFWLATMRQAVRLIRANHPVYSVVALGILASLLGTSTHMMVDRYSWRTVLQIIWVEAAIIEVMTRLQKAETVKVVNNVPVTDPIPAPISLLSA